MFKKILQANSTKFLAEFPSLHIRRAVSVFHLLDLYLDAISFHAEQGGIFFLFR
jgi:hypothetical protein